MFDGWQNGLLIFFRTASQILTAGVAITAFSLFIYALNFNLRDRVVRTFGFIMVSMVIISSAEALGSGSSLDLGIQVWLRLEWIGIIILPAAYYHFSDAILSTTGSNGHGRRRVFVGLSYLVTIFLLVGLFSPFFFSSIVMGRQPSVYVEPTALTTFFTLYYFLMMGLSWFNLATALRRTKTPTSRRRMAYLVVGAVAPAVGSFPYLLFGSGFAGRHLLIFWVISVFTNIMVAAGLVVMAYTVAFFGVTWSDRQVRSRLVKWIVRGPITASITLAVVTITRRLGEVFGMTYTALVPIVMVCTILLCQFLISLFGPLWERMFFFGRDRVDLDLLRTLENRMLTYNDLHQFLELILSAACDRLQAPGAYVVVLGSDEPQWVVTVGDHHLDQVKISNQVLRIVSEGVFATELFRWGDDYLIPLIDEDEDAEGEEKLLGLLSIAGAEKIEPDDEQRRALTILSQRAVLALRDRSHQQRVFQSLQTFAPEVAWMLQARSGGRYDDEALLETDVLQSSSDLNQWVKDALTHYWGGPKLTSSPLLQLHVVQEILPEYDGNSTNALRALLRMAIEKVRPEGDEHRRFTAEWILYNILEMKFLEGRKVREIALKLSMSEADLYRKQRVAIESVTKIVMQMEEEARVQAGKSPE